jgi:hypothetical protein
MSAKILAEVCTDDYMSYFATMPEKVRRLSGTVTEEHEAGTPTCDLPFHHPPTFHSTLCPSHRFWFLISCSGEPIGRSLHPPSITGHLRFVPQMHVPAPTSRALLTLQPSRRPRRPIFRKARRQSARQRKLSTKMLSSETISAPAHFPLVLPKNQSRCVLSDKLLIILHCEIGLGIPCEGNDRQRTPASKNHLHEIDRNGVGPCMV